MKSCYGKVWEKMADLNSSLTAMDWLPQLSVGSAMDGATNSSTDESLKPRFALRQVPGSPLDTTATLDADQARLHQGKIKPPYSYANLITFAINSSSKKKMTLSEIYHWIVEHFPFYQDAGNGWKNSIRHNLSLNKCFIKVARTKDDPGKGSYWAIEPNPCDDPTPLRQSRYRRKSERDRQSSPYRIEDGRYSPSAALSPLPTMMGHSPTNNTSHVASFAMSPSSLNLSFGSEASSTSYESGSSIPEITVTRGDKENTNSLLPDVKNCALDNKVFAEHFNLDDLSASFRSLYKSVFQQSSNCLNGTEPDSSHVLSGNPSLASTSSVANKNNAQLSMSLSRDNHPSSDIMKSMDNLMESLTTGDFSKVNPDEFYSLLDTLQGMDGLNQNDIEQLELSYGQFIKSRSGINFSHSLFDSRTSSNVMPIPTNHSPRGASPLSNSPFASPNNSPFASHNNSPFPSPNHSPFASPNHSPFPSPNHSPFASPNHSPVGSPVRQNALLSSGSLNGSNQLLSPHAHNRVSCNTAAHCSPCSSISNHSVYTNTTSSSLGSSLEQQYLQAASMAYGPGPRSSPLLPEEDIDEFDWSSIL